MTGWLTRATETFSRKTIESPEPFRVKCSCGNINEGMRTDNSQLILCPRCKNMVFVLPKSPYPALKQNVSKKNKNKHGKIITKPASESASHVDKVRITQRVKNRASKIKTGARERTIRLIQKQKAFFTPFRLILLFTFFCVGMTGYWLLYSNKVDSSTATFQLSIKNGHDALKQKDFLLAEKEFEKASLAASFLELKSEESNLAHQRYAELKAFNHLIPQSLHRMVEMAAKSDVPGEPAWEDNFQANFLDKWIILDTILYQNEQTKGPTGLVLDCPVMVNDIPIIIYTDLGNFEKLLEGESSKRIIVGAKIISCQIIKGKVPIVVLKFDAQSLFLWSYPELLTEAGIMESSDKNMAELLEKQLQYSGSIINE